VRKQIARTGAPDDILGQISANLARGLIPEDDFSIGINDVGTQRHLICELQY
jgi:hypothetical protein